MKYGGPTEVPRLLLQIAVLDLNPCHRLETQHQRQWIYAHRQIASPHCPGVASKVHLHVPADVYDLSPRQPEIRGLLTDLASTADISANEQGGIKRGTYTPVESNMKLLQLDIFLQGDMTDRVPFLS